MPDEQQLAGENEVCERSLGATIAAAAVTGTTAGVANAVTNQVIGALSKPKDDPPPAPKKQD